MAQAVSSLFSSLFPEPTAFTGEGPKSQVILMGGSNDREASWRSAKAS